MNRSKKLCILLGILVVACVATLAVMQMEARKEQIKNSEEIILEVPSDTVQSLSWEYEGNTLAFHKAENWLYDEDEAFPVSEERIHDLLEPFEAFGVSFIIEDVEDFGQYGLDNPLCTIDFATEEQSYQILVGDYSKMDSKRYVSIGDGNVYLVQNDPMDDFDTDLRAMIDNDETPEFGSVSKITLSGEENYTILYAEDSTDSYSSEDVYFAQQSGKRLPLDTNKVDSFLRNISYLNPTDYVSYNADETELASYGLDAPDLTITVDYTAEDEDGVEQADTLVLHISRDPEEKAAAEAKESDEEDSEDETVTAYVRVGESQIIYNLSSSRYQNLMAASYDDLRHSEVLWADFGDVQQIDILLEGNNYTISSKKDGDDRTYTYQDEELEIKDFKAALEALSAESFTSERATQKEEISLTVYLDNENYPQISIQFYRCDGTHCLAVVDGEPVSLVRRDAVVDLIEAVHAIVLN